MLYISTHCWKNLLIDFVIGLLILADWKGHSYNLILVIVKKLTKIVHYVPVKVMINTRYLVEVIINVVICHHGVLESIVTD